MTFTYNLAGTGDTLNIAKVRLEIGDTVQSQGVRPDKFNLSDEEIMVWLNEEGHVMRAVARACFALSRIWANIDGAYSERAVSVSSDWQSRGNLLVKSYGPVSGTGGISVARMNRDDGYHALNTYAEGS